MLIDLTTLTRRELIVVDVLVHHPNSGPHTIQKYTKEHGEMFKIGEVREVLESLLAKKVVATSDRERIILTKDEINRYSAGCSSAEYLVQLIRGGDYYEKGIFSKAMTRLIDNIDDMDTLKAIRKEVDRKTRRK